MNTVGVAMIVRDNEKTLRGALESVRAHVDQIVVVDTGSTDATIPIAAEYADKILCFDWIEDFSAARQYSFDHCDSDWIMWLDSDDVVEGAEHIKTVIANVPQGTTAVAWIYDTEVDAHGNATVENWRERLTKRNTAIWMGRVHEMLVPLPGGIMIRESSVIVHHRPLAERSQQESAERNVKILREMLAAEQPPRARTLFYLARDLMPLGRLDEALDLFNRYLTIADWTQERYIAQIIVSAIYRIQHRWAEAIQSDLAAARITPTWPHAWFGLAESMFFQEKYRESIAFSRCGQAMPEPDATIYYSPQAFSFDWMLYYVVSLSKVGEFDEALAVTRRALAIQPAHEQHNLNLSELEKLVFAANGRKQIVYEPFTPIT